MQVARGGQAQRALQQDLPRSVVCQVLAAHDVCDALGAVVHHDRELVGPQAVCAFEHKVANGLGNVLLLRSQPPVPPCHLLVCY